MTPLTDGRFYLYATAVVPAGIRSDDPRAELRRRFGAWHDPIPALLDRVDRLPLADVLRHDLHELAAPLPRLHHGRIAWLGDAAHAMAPNLGQGGCQAIEDAVVLAHLARGEGGGEVVGDRAGPAGQFVAGVLGVGRGVVGLRDGQQELMERHDTAEGARGAEGVARGAVGGHGQHAAAPFDLGGEGGRGQQLGAHAAAPGVRVDVQFQLGQVVLAG
ncbi:hypothetical protein STANM309S_04436 [Streptomyces tanashiensis]